MENLRCIICFIYYVVIGQISHIKEFFCYATATNCCKLTEYWRIVSTDIFFNCCLLCHGIYCLSSQDDKAFVFGEWTAEAFTQGDDLTTVMLRVFSELTMRRSCESGGTLSEVVLFTVNF